MAGWRQGIDYSQELQRTDLTSSQRSQLEQERQNKINDMYGGKEPGLNGSSQTFSSLYTGSGGSLTKTQKSSGGYNYSRPSASVTPTTQSDPYSGRDIASEIIGLLTKGGEIDYGQLNNLAAQRDAKMATNPDYYGQFETTDSLIQKYLPFAQQNEKLYLQNQQMQQQIDQMNQKPSSDVDSLIELLTSVANSSVPRMSFNEAQVRAQQELNPMYSKASDQLTQQLNADMERRGIYNAPLASGIMTEKQGQLSNDQVAAIAERANSLIENDAEMSLAEKQLRQNTLSSLLSTLIGREMNTAELTGMYNGSPTLAKQTLDTQTGLAEAELTGKYNGQDTVASRAQQVQNALSAVNMMGKVTTQEQADILGVPIGTPSAAAAQAAQELQFEQDKFNRQMSFNAAQQRASQSAKEMQTMLENFNKDMIVWETTGASPDTPAMRYYGITPGTPFTQQTAQGKLAEAQAQIQLVEAEAELQFQNRGSELAGQYGLNQAGGEAMALILDANSDFNSARGQVNSQRSALAAEGINVNSLISALDGYYKASTPVTTSQPVVNNSGAPSTTPIPARMVRELGNNYLSSHPELYYQSNGNWYMVQK